MLWHISTLETCILPDMKWRYIRFCNLFGGGEEMRGSSLFLFHM